jgi:ABC-type transport system involved in cytochrome c biogenesis permease subunit
MTWQAFPWFLAVASCIWALSAVPRMKYPGLCVLLGTAVIGVFIGGLWVELDRPPMRTLGETRLWFGVLLPLAGCITWRLVPWRWTLQYAVALAFLFLLFTALRPETHDRTLMPALQSPWFVPHVVLYLIAYAFLIHTAVVALLGSWRTRNGREPVENYLMPAETSLWIGFAFLTLGLLAGAVWAKEAWGHYWTWDPKETWAFLTWAVYLVYFHLRPEWSRDGRRALLFLALASIVVFICWFGLNYLPSAAQSVHTYTR